jgi:hypothetical protein
MPKFSASASATTTSSGTATATGNTESGAIENAKTAALNAAKNPKPEKASNKKKCTEFCLSCIDFRFADHVNRYQNLRNKINDYDLFILAGSSLGYNGIPDFEEYTPSFDKTVDVAKKLHDITEISIYDHLGCGAYALVYSEEELAGNGEFDLHVKNLNIAEQTILKKFPFITKVHKFIVDDEYFSVTPIF